MSKKEIAGLLLKFTNLKKQEIKNLIEVPYAGDRFRCGDVLPALPDR